MARWRATMAGLALALLASASNAAEDTLTDAALTAYAAQPFDRQAMMGRQVVIGVHHGAKVVAEFPCSDVCPDYTTRIIHYDAAPGPACDAIGGVTAIRRVPFSIAVVEKPFCVPKVLADGG